jgi:hypothetical protein
MTGVELATLAEEINGGASIGDTLLEQLLNMAKALVERRRPWMVLRSTDTSKSVTTANTWQTAIDLSTIARFNRFYGEDPIQLFDGTRTIARYRQVPWNMRLQYKDASNTFVYDEANKMLYLNGTVPFAGTLYIDHIKDGADIDIISDDSAWAFPSWSHYLLPFLAVGIHKGGIDFDDINARMAPDNRAMADSILDRLEVWDNEKQLQASQNIDPYDNGYDDWRSGAINL